MITIEDAINIAKNDAKEQNAIVSFLIDYDKSHYVYGYRNIANTIDQIRAVDTTYRAIDKDDGFVSNFIVGDFSKFLKLTTKHNILTAN